MVDAKTLLVSCISLTYSLLILVRCIEFESEMCLERAITIHTLLTQKVCSEKLTEGTTGIGGCSVQCKGKYITNNTLYNANHCVGYNIRFHINKTLITMLKDRACDVPKCIIKEIDFECTFLGNTSSKENHHHDINPENESCIDVSTSVLIFLSCVFGGSLVGISIFVSLKRWMTNKQRLHTPPVFYQHNYGDGCDLSEERCVTISNPQGTDYADIKDTIRMVAKAIQVPSYEEDSSSETRSREIIYHHLSLTEDSTKKENSDLVSSDSIPDSFADNMIISNNGSPSFKSVVISAESSSKSNGNSKVSPTGSAGSDK